MIYFINLEILREFEDWWMHRRCQLGGGDGRLLLPQLLYRRLKLMQPKNTLKFSLHYASKIHWVASGLFMRRRKPAWVLVKDIPAEIASNALTTCFAPFSAVAFQTRLTSDCGHKSQMRSKDLIGRPRMILVLFMCPYLQWEKESVVSYLQCDLGHACFSLSHGLTTVPGQIPYEIGQSVS